MSLRQYFLSIIGSSQKCARPHAWGNHENALLIVGACTEKWGYTGSHNIDIFTLETDIHIT